MPCSKRMMNCAIGCRHRELVTDYQQERERQETAPEQDPHQQDGFREAEPPITFKQWLIARQRYE